MSEKKTLKFVHTAFCLEILTELLKNDSVHFKIVNPLPKDAKFFDLKYDSSTRTLHLFFTSEKGYERKEGELLSSVPVTDILFKTVKSHEFR